MICPNYKQGHKTHLFIWISKIKHRFKKGLEGAFPDWRDLSILMRVEMFYIYFKNALPICGATCRCKNNVYKSKGKWFCKDCNILIR